MKSSRTSDKFLHETANRQINTQPEKCRAKHSLHDRNASSNARANCVKWQLQYHTGQLMSYFHLTTKKS